jgi:hypothetical protein
LEKVPLQQLEFMINDVQRRLQIPEQWREHYRQLMGHPTGRDCQQLHQLELQAKQWRLNFTEVKKLEDFMSRVRSWTKNVNRLTARYKHHRHARSDRNVLDKTQVYVDEALQLRLSPEFIVPLTDLIDRVNKLIEAANSFLPQHDPMTRGYELMDQLLFYGFNDHMVTKNLKQRLEYVEWSDKIKKRFGEGLNCEIIASCISEGQKLGLTEQDEMMLSLVDAKNVFDQWIQNGVRLRAKEKITSQELERHIMGPPKLLVKDTYLVRWKKLWGEFKDLDERMRALLVHRTKSPTTTEKPMMVQAQELLNQARACPVLIEGQVTLEADLKEAQMWLYHLTTAFGKLDDACLITCLRHMFKRCLNITTSLYSNSGQSIHCTCYDKNVQDSTLVCDQCHSCR